MRGRAPARGVCAVAGHDEEISFVRRRRGALSAAAAALRLVDDESSSSPIRPFSIRRPCAPYTLSVAKKHHTNVLTNFCSSFIVQSA